LTLPGLRASGLLAYIFVITAESIADWEELNKEAGRRGLLAANFSRYVEKSTKT
jgi:hypothetical protein